MSKAFQRHDFSLGTKIRLPRCYIIPVLLYGAEIWTLTESKKIDALEMWPYRRILKIPRTDRVSNLRVLPKNAQGKTIARNYKISETRSSESHNEKQPKIWITLTHTSRENRIGKRSI